MKDNKKSVQVTESYLVDLISNLAESEIEKRKASWLKEEKTKWIKESKDDKLSLLESKIAELEKKVSK